MKARKCNASNLFTGTSACQLDYGKVKGALVVPSGTKLPADLTGKALEELCHASALTRVQPIAYFVEFAMNGGDVATSAVGYGPTQANGVNARTDQFTMEKFSELLAATLMKTANSALGVYYVDENNVIYGLNDGTDILAPFEMSTIYPTVTPHPTSSALASLVVNFCHKDARKAIENLDFEVLDFDVFRFAKGLVPVKLVKQEGVKFKLLEAIGGYDRTEEFGALMQTAGKDIFSDTAITGVTYADGILTLTGSTADTVTLADPATLYDKKIKGIVSAE